MSGTDKVVLEAPVKKKSKKGTPENPHKLQGRWHKLQGRWHYTESLKEGVTEFWIIEIQNKKGGKWVEHDESDYASSYKEAQRQIKNIQDELVEEKKYHWQKKNLNATRTKSYRVILDNTLTKDFLEQTLAEIRNDFEKIKESNKKAAKMPEFKVPDYPRFRAVRRTIAVTTITNEGK